MKVVLVSSNRNILFCMWLCTAGLLQVGYLGLVKEKQRDVKKQSGVTLDSERLNLIHLTLRGDVLSLGWGQFQLPSANRHIGQVKLQQFQHFLPPLKNEACAASWNQGHHPKTGLKNTTTINTQRTYKHRASWKNNHKKLVWLVVWTPLKNMSQLGWLFPIYGKIKNVPNHQPASVLSVVSYPPHIISHPRTHLCQHFQRKRRCAQFRPCPAALRSLGRCWTTIGRHLTRTGRVGIPHQGALKNHGRFMSTYKNSL